MSTSGGSAGNPSSTHTLASAQLLALHTAPVVLAPAPGAGLVVVPTIIVVSSTAGRGALSSSGAPSFTWGNNAGDAGHLFPVVPILPALTAAAPNDGIDFIVWPISAGLAPTELLAGDLANEPFWFTCASSDPNPVSGIATATVNAGGTGYVIGDTGVITAVFYGAGATYAVTAVGGGGAVTAFTITDGGDGFDLFDNPIPTTTGGSQPGVGTGFLVDAVTLTPITTTVTVHVEYFVTRVA